MAGRGSSSTPETSCKFNVHGHALLRNLHNRQFSPQCVEDGSQSISVTRSIVDLESNKDNAAHVVADHSAPTFPLLESGQVHTVYCGGLDKGYCVEDIVVLGKVDYMLYGGKALYVYIAQIELFDEMSQMVQVNFMLEKDEIHF